MIDSTNFLRYIRLTVYGLFLAIGGTAQAQPAFQPIQAIPPNVGTIAPKPMIMLNMSKDHQLFYRAYNEYTDINFDGNPDVTYNHSIDYYGYFDSYKCYTYNGTSGRFVAASVNTNRYCSGAWSGNFLNWATMTRMDVVRKVLYGGLRSTDTSSLTVLERAHLPTDAHAFAKYYAGSDLTQLTPFTTAQMGTVTLTVNGVSATVSEITMCNVTLGGSGVNRLSHTNTNPPLLRVARGDFSLWNAGERWQCRWRGEESVSNGNNTTTTGLRANSLNPRSADEGLTTGGNGPDFIVRVEACPTTLIGRERCKQYPNGNVKPIGLLHEFGENESAEFALLTGSFDRNISGGILRRNMGSFRNEVNWATDGTWVSTVNGIVRNIDRLRIYGYDYNDGTYRDIDSDGNWCEFQLTSLTNNQCTSWGNPIGEMFLETLRYFAGATPQSTFQSATRTKDDAVGLTRETWIDPFLRSNATERANVEARYGRAQCRPLNTITFNASVNSYDRDDLAGFSTLSTANLLSLVNIIGVDEGIQGTRRFVGRVGGTGDSICTAKTVTSLGEVDGLCPDAPAYQGSYSLAGAAWWARTNRIRTDIAAPANLTNAFKMNSYSVALSPGKPRITVVSQTDPTRRVVIQPAYRLNHPTRGTGGGTLVDFRIVTQTPTYGRYLIVWEDSEQGGDYDQDASGILEYYVNGNQLRVVTRVFAAATANPQGFGYTISGTNNDGVRFHSGIIGFSFTDPSNPSVTATNPARLNASGGCNNCNVNDPPTTATYTITGGAAGVLEDPLYYAAKWGGFFDSATNPTGRPDSPSKWDQRLQNGAPGSDGIPDNYYVVFRADLLENALRTVFRAITDSSNAAPAASSTQLTAGSFKYIVKFDSRDISGQLQGFRLLPDGTFEAQASLNGHERLTNVDFNSRVIISNDVTGGVPFRWANLSSTFRTSTLVGTETAAVGEARVNYIRGDRSNESPNGRDFRARNITSILGGIVNSNPWLQTRPIATTQWVGTTDTVSYLAFANTWGTRRQLIWAGANDGMLHGFRADTLEPVMSYFPGVFAPRIPSLTFNPTPNPPAMTAFADGSPFTGDVRVGGAWRTYLFQTLGRGGRGVYALDVTDPSQLIESNAANVFRWSFTSNDDPDFGHVISENSVNLQSFQPNPIARMNNGRYAVIFGNGASGGGGKAALFVLYVDGPSATRTWTLGTHYDKIVLDNTGANGLSEPVWIDVDGNGTADFIYAGDQRGNLWKVDVTSSSASSWQASYGGPLFIAVDRNSNRLPISTAVDLTQSPLGGYMVTFATGRSLVDADFPDATGRTNAMFGIWDRTSLYNNSPTAVPRGLSELATRTFVAAASAVATSGTGTVTISGLRGLFGLPLNVNTQKGWYVPFLEPSEMTVSNNTRLGGSLGVISITPAASASVVTCDSGAQGNLTIVNPLTGLPSASFFRLINVINPITGATVTVAAASSVLGDQKVRIVGDRTGTTGSGRLIGSGNIRGTQQGGTVRRIIGQSTDFQLSTPDSARRSGYREVPGLRTLQ